MTARGVYSTCKASLCFDNNNASSARLRCQIISAITHNTKTPTKRLIKAHSGSIPGGEKKNPASSRIEIGRAHV